MRSAILLVAGLLLLVDVTPASALVPAPIRGVRITSVAPNSAARRAGLEVNDVIVAIDGFPVRVPADVNQLLGNRRGAVTVTLLDRRTGTYTETTAFPVRGHLGVNLVSFTLAPPTIVPISPIVRGPIVMPAR